MHQSFSIDYNYDVLFTSRLFAHDNKTLVELLQKDKGLSKVAFVIDQGVLDHHKELIDDIQSYFGQYAEVMVISGSPLVVTGGEEVKNSWDEVVKVLELINTAKLDRHSYLIAIGGGAVLDMVGLSAAIGHRGIRHIRIPTTVLSQNDSGVGVKNGINYFGKKNFIGSFAPPYAVINDSHFLTTLSERDWRSGITEAIKVALLKSPSFFDWIVSNTEALNDFDLEVMETLVHKCAEHHLKHISSSGDPFEQGSSRPLDFGHWATHKLEQMTSFEIRHGEALAIGLALDITYSYLSGFIDEKTYEKIIQSIEVFHFDIFHPLLLDSNSENINPELLDGLEEFREHLGGELTIILIKSIGEQFEVHDMNAEILQKSALVLKEKCRTNVHTA